MIAPYRFFRHDRLVWPTAVTVSSAGGRDGRGAARVSGVGLVRTGVLCIQNAVPVAVRAAVLADDEPLFDFSNQPALYFFADRPNPTRFFQIPIVSPPRFQKEVIRDLEATRPPLVLRRSPDHLDRFDGLDNRDRAQAVVSQSAAGAVRKAHYTL